MSNKYIFYEDKVKDGKEEEPRVSITLRESDHRPSLDKRAIPKASLEIARVYEEQKQREQIKIEKQKKKREKTPKKPKKKKVKRDHVAIDEHKLSLKELAERYDTSVNFDSPKDSKGLTNEEAKQRLAKNGPNQLTPAKVTPMWVKFILQFVSFFPLLLEAGGTLCLIAYGLDTSTRDNLYLGVILWLVVIITAVFSFMQEAKSSAVMDGFKKLAPQYCKVIREGSVMETNALNLVIGDIVFVKSGDKVPADIRIIHCQGLKVDNSSLTGEAEPQTRSEECTDENYLETHNLAFFSTLANEGEAFGIVIRTGDNTVIGNIAGLVSSTKNEDTPLRTEISRFIKIISVVAISLGVIFLIVGFITKIHWVANIVFMIGIIVANVPEGLLPTVTVALTLTAKRLAAKNVLVKNLEAVETLGSTSTICSDKTGTLTMNRMTVVHLFYDLKLWTVDEISTEGSFDKSSPSFLALQNIGILCNRCVFDPDAENMKLPITQRKTVGDASETALIKFYEPITPILPYRQKYAKLAEVPFNSATKWQLSVHADGEGSVLVMKGAPERVIDLCDTIMIDGKAVPLEDHHKEKFQQSYETLAGHGERVLGFAHRVFDPKEYPRDYEFDVDKKNFPVDKLTFVGLCGLMDPPKPNVPDAVAKCKQAGVRVIMVTGDHPLTAASIARQVGIIESEVVDDISALRRQMEEAKGHEVTVTTSPNAIVIKGSDIPELTTDEWESILSRRQVVFARTSPEQKLEIVEHCQKRGEIVAVTGDGVNDSPALKKADLGCAMGISGSDVSKDAADVILLDDNFASIVAGVEEGRIIFDNLKKSITYTLSSNSAELLPFISFAILQMPLALSAVLILCIDLGTDMIPAISLAYEKPELDIMKRPPRSKKDRLVSLKLAVFSYIHLGTIQAIAGYLAFFVTMNDYGFAPREILWIANTYFRPDSPDWKGLDAAAQKDILYEGQTAFFVAVVLTRMACVIICKTRKLSMFQQGFTNWVFNLGLLSEIGLLLILCYVPGVSTVFGTRPVSWKIWVIGIPFFCFVIILDELRKWAIRRKPFGLMHKITYW